MGSERSEVTEDLKAWQANEAAQLAAAQSGGLQIGGNAAPPAAQLPDNTVPSNQLFVENLPPNTADQSLKMLFGQFAGFQDVRWQLL